MAMRAPLTDTIVANRPDPVGASAWNFQQLRVLWMRAGGDPATADIAAAIALAESGGRPHITNHIGAAGLWQIHGLPFAGNPLDPLTNAKMAVAKWKSAGKKFTPWTTYTGADTPGHQKTYLKYLPKSFGQDIGGAASSVGSAVSGAADTVTAIPKFVGTLASAIFNPDWWLRVGLILLGMIALGFGLYFMGREFVGGQIGKVLRKAR